LPKIHGTAEQGDALRTTSGKWNGSPTSYRYLWQVCNSAGLSCNGINGATSQRYIVAASDVGGVLRSIVTASNAGGSSAAESPTTAVVTFPGGAPAAPANTGAPLVSGTSTQGDVLTTTTGSWLGSPASYASQWQRCASACSNISGATGSTYTLQAADVGDTVRSVVTASNSGGSASANSVQTAAVLALPPVNDGAPVVTGTATTGDTLSTSNGSWLDSPSSYTYQWQRCSSGCLNIGGATGSTYTLQAADVGDTVRAVVTASNSGGSASADSTQTGKVVNIQVKSKLKNKKKKEIKNKKKNKNKSKNKTKRSII